MMRRELLQAARLLLLLLRQLYMGEVAQSLVLQSCMRVTLQSEDILVEVFPTECAFVLNALTWWWSGASLAAVGPRMVDERSGGHAGA